MKKLLLLLVLAPALAMGASADQAPVGTEESPPESPALAGPLGPDTPVLRLNGRTVAKIWYDRILAEVARSLEQAWGSHGASNEQVRRLALERLIDQEVLYDLAVQEDIPGLEEESEARFRAFVERVGGEGPFREGLAAQGMEERHIRHIIRRELASTWYVQNVIGRDVTVSEEDARSFYEAKKGKEYVHPELRKIYQILAAGARGEESARRRLAEVREKFKEGQGFGALALEYSDDPLSRLNDGFMGYRAADELPAEVAEACFSAVPGELTEIVPSSFGYHVFLVTEIVPPRNTPFEEVRDEVFRRAREVKIQKAVDRTIKRAGREVKVEVLMHP